MRRFENISLAYECDQPTLERAAALAKDQRAQLTLVYAIKAVADEWAQVSVGRTAVDVRELLYREARDRVREAARSVHALGVRPATRLLIGEPSLEIVRDVLEHGRDLVIVTADKSATGRRKLAGLAGRLIRKCPVPLLVMKPGKRSRFRRVVAAVDPQSTGDSRDTLNHQVLELASAVAELNGAELYVVHAWLMVGDSTLWGRSGLSREEIASLTRSVADERRSAVAALTNPYAAAEPRLHLLKGNAGDVIPRFVKSRRADLLVMGTVCRTGLPGFVIGNTAERVLSSVDCSVLVVKPDGFVSPVAEQVARAR
ncbi:MAG TPA: universal stress protein [Thermoanaerobaculia bacterium]|nr:universal stress protein [Thermoanaerobaculia bacterium]